MLVEDLHEQAVGVGEISELASQLVLPLDAVKKVVSVAQDYDEHGNHAITRIAVCAIDDLANQPFLIPAAEMQVVKMVGELAVGELAAAEI